MRKRHAEKRNVKKISMQRRVSDIVFVCWLLPMALMIAVSFYYLFFSNFDEQMDHLKTQMEFNSRICAERLNHVIDLSRAATADGMLERVWTKYEKGESSYQTLYVRSTGYLTAEYQQKGVMDAILWWYDNPEAMNGSTVNGSGGGSFQQVQDYWREDHQAAKELLETLDTSVGFLNRDGRVYLVRNLMNRSFVPMGALVLRLNADYCFDAYKQSLAGEHMTIWLNDQKLSLKGEPLDPISLGLATEESAKVWKASPDGGNYVRKNNKVYVMQSMKTPDYMLAGLMQLDSEITQTPLYGYRYVYAGMVLFLFPLLAALSGVFRSHVTEPLKTMMDGIHHIQEGELGYQISYEPKNREFQYLKEGINGMSERLKYQFEHIYEEELALRDARIMALQSNINPHFMNNTLEIINWEARMGDNAKVSKMIESLAILMDAAMDRKRKAEVPLSEEMMYVDAYLYIISERFGKRLTIEKEIAPDTLRIPVPRLILQPVIENAVEHGVRPGGTGYVKIKSRRDGSFLYLETENGGSLTRETQEKINRLLSPDYDTSQESSGNLGIANVNQRLKILYGEECGLTIGTGDGPVVTARLTVRIASPCVPGSTAQAVDESK